MEPESLPQIDRTFVRFRGRKLSYFSGCDYFRLSSHPRVQKALVNGLRRHGANVAASRVTTGNHRLYRDVESALASFFAVEASLVVSTGYAANLIAAQGLAGDFEHGFLDARAHVSLRDATQFLGCPVTEFPHRDPAGLTAAWKQAGRKRKIILLTDGMFAYDGALAPLRQYAGVLPQSVMMLVDDAHGAGILGCHGRGAVELAGAPPERVLQTITLSKAFGAYGGAILGSRALRQRLVARSAMFAGSTPAPLPQMSAALASIDLLRQRGGALRRRLENNGERVKSTVRRAGQTLPDTPAPIVPLVPCDGRHSNLIRRTLLRRRVFPSFIRYPGGPASGYFRFVISSEHTPRQIDDLIAALSECYK